MKARRLKAIAAWINENVSELHAEVRSSYCNTDRKVGRLRWPGKGRNGNEILVFKSDAPCFDEYHNPPVFRHNAAETYRSNDEVERWLADYLKNRKARKT